MVKFKNSKGKELKTTLSGDIMSQIADIVEGELNKYDIPYLRDVTNFSVYKSDMDFLFKSQEKATRMLMKKGVITEEMIKNDVKQNFE